MRELSFNETQAVSGGDAWAAASIGLVAMGGAIAVAAAPAVGAAVGLCAMGAAAANAMSSYSKGGSGGGAGTKKNLDDSADYFIVII